MLKDFGSINLCIHITLKRGCLTIECTNTNKTSRRARRYCQFRCDIWIVDWTKWLCRHLPCHACNYGRTVANVEIDLQFIVTLIAVVIISSFGVAGVGGGATFASILVLSTLNLPVALAGVLISVEPLIDMGRTALNVNDSMLAGTGTAKLTKHWDKDTFDSNDNAALTSH